MLSKASANRKAKVMCTAGSSVTNGGGVTTPRVRAGLRLGTVNLTVNQTSRKRFWSVTSQTWVRDCRTAIRFSLFNRQSRRQSRTWGIRHVPSVAPPTKYNALAARLGGGQQQQQYLLTVSVVLVAVSVAALPIEPNSLPYPTRAAVAGGAARLPPTASFGNPTWHHPGLEISTP